MKKEILPLGEALARGKALPCALIRSVSGVTLGRTPDAVSTDELLEARFFSETEEIRVFRGADGLCAARVAEEPGDPVIEACYEIDNAAFGRRITVRRHLGFDGDGQAFVETVRPAKWEGGEENG